MDAFIQAYSTLKYTPCENSELESGYEKVAIYTNENGVPTHATRQLPDGTWTSKLGKDVDIEHESLQVLEGSAYGKVKLFLKRPRA